LYAKVYIEITKACGLNCSFCEPKKGGGQEMEQDTFEEINRQLKGRTKTIAYHLLGDPLCVKNLPEYLNISAKYGHSIDITTSGVYLQKEQFNTLLHPSVRQINFSLSALGANLFSPEKIERILQNIFEFCVVSIQNPKRFVNLRIWNLKGGERSEFHNYLLEKIGDFFGVKGIVLDKTRLAPYTLISIQDEFEWPSLDKQRVRQRGSCSALSGQIAFLSDGTLVPCCMDAAGIIALGNIKNKSIKEILNSERAQKMALGFKKEVLEEPLCQSCGFRARED